MRISDWSSDVCSSDLCRCGKVGEAQPFQESGLSCILYGQDVFHTLLLTVHENAIAPFADRLCEGVTQSVANRRNVQVASVSVVDLIPPLAQGVGSCGRVATLRADRWPGRPPGVYQCLRSGREHTRPVTYRGIVKGCGR